jgi:flagellin-specific chaperone FliS
MNSMTASAHHAARTYQREQLLNLSSVEVIHKLYDIAIISCKRNDLAMAQRTINELIVGLNFEAGDMAINLYNLYDFCKRSIRNGHVYEAIAVLEELRLTWAQAFSI